MTNSQPSPAAAQAEPSPLIDVLLIAGVAAAAVIAVAQSWHGWLDPIIDTGRDLYIPEQLRHGTKLYRDIAYYYPPLTPYLLAAITAITGSSIAAYTGIGMAIATLTAAALWFAARITAGAIAGFSAALLFVTCSIAGRSTWGTNYFFPYSHAVTLATLFFVAFVAFLCAHLFARRSDASLAAALSFALAASWTKLEFVGFTTIVIVIAFVVHRIRVRWLIGYVIAALCTIGFVTLVFRDSPPGRNWLFDNVAPATLLRSPYLHDFYAEVTGVAHWPFLLGRSLAGALVLVAVVTLLAAAERAPKRSTRVLCIGVAAIAALLLLFDDRFFRAWTVLQVALIPVAVRRPREPLLILLAASLCTTSRVFFQIVPVWYGFVFLVPLYLLIAYVFFAWLPQRRIYSRRGELFLLLLVIVIALQSLGSAHTTYGRKTHAIVTSRGVLYDASAGRAAGIDTLADTARREHMKSLVVFPEGLALNYLLQVPTPIAYYTFTPPEAADPAIETRILSELEQKRPQWIAFVPRSVTEFGAVGFGVDYDQRIAAYVRTQYAPAGIIRNEGFTLALYRRRE